MKSKTAIRKLLSKGFEVSSFAKLWIKPQDDGTFVVAHGEIFDAREGKTTHDPKEEKFDSRRKAIKHFMQRRRELLPVISAPESNGEAEPATATAAKQSSAKKKAKKKTGAKAKAKKK